jgi:hypothetical protein
MKPKFIAAVQFEDKILMIEEYGDVYEFRPHTGCWELLAKSPWPAQKLSPDFFE